LKEELAAGLLRSKVEEIIAADAQITETQAQEFYQANQETYTEPAGMKISHILVDSEDKAKDIIKQLQAGADFAALAASTLPCPSSSRGGDLGPVNADTPMVEEFKNAAWPYRGTNHHTTVKSEFGYHVIKANGKQAAGVIPFAEVKAEIIQQLQDQAVGTYLDQLYQQAQINDLRKK
jgi:parvulin-like peptidyl-prolyl isomerase